MKVHHKTKQSNRYFILTGEIVAACFILCLVWLIFPITVNKGEKVVEFKKSAVLATKPKSTAVSTPEIPTPPVIAADYYLPPVANGLAPVIYKLSTDQKIVFLGIDDGVFKDQSVVDIMNQYHIKASLFLSEAFIASDPDFFNKLVAQGSYVEDHTLHHDTSMVKNEGYDQQKMEICGMADYELVHYGRRPTLFRPPGGAYSDTMRQAAADCGMKAVVTWIAKANGGAMQYQVGNKLNAGDIVLMHFRPQFMQDMKAFIDAMNASGLHTALLEDALM